MQLVDESGQDLATEETDSSGTAALSLEQLTPGTYWLRVFSRSGTGAYTLKLSIGAPGNPSVSLDGDDTTTNNTKANAFVLSPVEDHR